MGRVLTPKYYAVVYDQKGAFEIFWKGHATDKRAEAKRRAMNRSFNPGGANFHVAEALGFIPHVYKLEVVRNDGSNTVVATANAPMFEVVD